MFIKKLHLLKRVLENFKLVFRPVLINGFVYYRNSKICRENWGDDINFFFLREIIKNPILIYNQISLANRFKLRNYLVIGSTIDMLCKKNTEVWGAGIINGTKSLETKPSKVHAVRGPLSRAKLLEEGVECPEVYGDPALLISRFYRPKVKRKYLYGLIPHCTNVELVNNFKIEGDQISKNKDFLIINLSNYQSWTDVVDQICSCDNILSASLHGLIVAESYSIPNVWIEFGKPLIGKHFKFHDFFLSIGKDREAPYKIEDYDLSLSEIREECLSWKPRFIDLQPLIDAAPFPLRIESS